MRIEDIQAEWEIDTAIDKTNLGNEALKIPRLLGKYYKIYVREVLQLEGMRESLNLLNFEKWEFFSQGPTEEALARGWKFPPVCILKQDIPRYLEADTDLIREKLKLSKQKEKVAFLKHIIDALNNRRWELRIAVDFLKFQAGG